jgi:hypothetical protein
MPVRYTSGEFEKVVAKNRHLQHQFLSGNRLAALQKLFSPKGKAVRTEKNYTYKLLIEIGLQTLKVKVNKGKTKHGYDKITVSFHKSNTESWFNNSDLRYDPICCNHLLTYKKDGNFNNLWYKSFTNSLNEEDFKKIPKGVEVKCVVAHREEKFEQYGQQMYYKQGRNIGKPIVLLKPEIEKVYHIDTPDSEIEIDYFKLYKRVK